MDKEKSITTDVVLEEGTFLEKLLKALQDKTSELEKLREKKIDPPKEKE